jgi:hypothetical protein
LRVSGERLEGVFFNWRDAKTKGASMSDLPITIDSLDAVPEESRKFYKQGEDGKFAINPAELLSALAAKDKALSSERKIRTDFETRFNKTAKELESIDRDKYAKLMEQEKEWETEKEQRERETLEAKGKYEEALERTKSNFSKELSDLQVDYEKKIKKTQETIERVEGDKKNYILNDLVRRAITKSGVFADDVEDVLTLTRNRFALDDHLNVVVRDESGNAITDLGIDSFFSEQFKKQKPKFYQGSNASGSGSSAGSGKNAHANAGANSDLSPVAKIAQGLAQRK